MRRFEIVLIAFVVAVATLVPQIGGSPTSHAADVQIGRVHSRFQPEDGKIFVLLLGHDARPGESRSRADAIHLAGINTETMKGGILNFPRDSYVSIPGVGQGRINEALFYGGPELVAKTVESITGIPIDYWAIVGFDGFQSAVGAIGGVEMKLPGPVYDVGASGAQLDAGRQTLTGWQALAYMRARKVFQGGDIQRTTNQGRFLLAALKKLSNETKGNPSRVFKWMSAVNRFATTSLTPDEMFRLGVLASQVSKKKVGNVTVPTSGGTVGAASVVFISSAAAAIYARFRSTGSL